eukprot:Blabericola_migrator_1__4643@NODE_245_length_10909_cov_149_723298_g207_i0_p4_GENE_NODE_245_length_10909_cov_149_723298_g207_i0NODE_245_length_10909_cov_149_723298_g207_i0_p4_ORF_typecomplete_len449_score65_92Not1/PF04054_15/6e02Not1/PF04054_15/1_7e65_NODE_245_length_10909_cov_149_723298_g207_i015932939
MLVDTLAPDFSTPPEWLDPDAPSRSSQSRAFAEDLLELFRLLKAQSDTTSNGLIKQSFVLKSALQSIVISIQESDPSEATADAHCQLLLALLIHFIAAPASTVPFAPPNPDKLLEADNIMAFALALMEVSPMRVPYFTFGYIRILCNPVFIPTLLKPSRGWSLLSRLLLPLLKFVGIMQVFSTTPPPPEFDLLTVATLRLFLIIIHDFPAFLSEYCFTLCGVLPPKCAQLRNLIFSAYPAGQVLPDPTQINITSTADPEWLKETPVLHDWTPILFSTGVFDHMKAYYLENDDNQVDTIVKKLSLKNHKSDLTRKEAYLNRTKYNTQLISAIVIDIIVSSDPHLVTLDWANFVVQAAKDRGIQLICHLMDKVDIEGQTCFFNCICDHLRHPNSHTVLTARLVKYMADSSDTKRKLVEKIVEDRTNVFRPHPWGLLAAKLSFQQTSQINN